MVDHTDVGNASELQFFGKMTASISHEIKNVMAIINESAGLLEDYSLMAEKGMPIDPERLKVVSERVTTQIRRADRITKNLNSMAHSVDGFHKSIDLGETLELAVGLSGRFADMRGVRLKFQPSSDVPTVITSPFHLLNLIWRVLDFAMDALGADKMVGLTYDSDAASVKIKFTGLATPTAAPGAVFPTAGEEALLHLLGATIHRDAMEGEITLILPKDVRQQVTAES
jgi:C4-dicarboxylate-specific signal transduction histidine kinase